MSELSLEWSSRAGPATLALLAGPWRRNEDPAATRETFRVHVPVDAKIAATALPAPGQAARRLLAALRGAPSGGELQRVLAGPGSLEEASRALLELADRATAPATVETRHGDRVVAVTELPACGSLSVRVAADAAAAAIMTLHAQGVAAALTTRVALLRVVLETTQLATVIAGSAGRVGPALPLAWRFLHHLLAEHAASPDGD